MSNTTVTTCSGKFNDSGGSGGQYGNNQDLVMTFCPTTPGDQVKIVFTGFNIQNGSDFLYVYDGPNTSSTSLGTYSGVGLPLSPGTTQATSGNPSGCLTFRFTSDGSTTQPGWQSDISCVTPCQIINSVLNSTNPPAQADGIIRICQGGTVTFNGSGTFSKSGTGASYVWDLDNGITANGASVTKTFNNPGVSLVNLNITDLNGCVNDNKINQVVHVSTTPSFAGTTPAASSICLGQSTTIPGAVTPTKFIYNCTPPVSGITFLPDGTGVSYKTSVTVDCFNSNVTVTNGTQIQNVCLNMEHSYMGDLSINLSCPNGQSMNLLSYATNAGGGTIIGNPVATVLPVDDNTGVTTPGIGMNYCWSPSGSAYIDDAGSWNYLATYTDPVGNVSSGIYQAKPGTYKAEGNWNNFIGCPLNGKWTIKVTDNLGADNGYIFSWGMTLDPSIVPASYTFTPTVSTKGWVADPTIVSTSGNTITVRPTAAGSKCYKYQMTDNFNCTYDTTVCITVNAGSFPGTNNTLTVCNSDPSTNLFSILGVGATTNGTWSGPTVLTGGYLGTFNPATGSSGAYTYSVPAAGSCPASSATITVTLSGVLPVSVVVSPSSNPICAGTSVTFTATPTNGGTTPSYQWYLNGNPVGSNSSTYTNAALANGNQVYVKLTSNASCATGSPATSNTVNMTVNPNLPVSVSLSASANPICAGTSVTFTATPTNGGVTPVYQWLLNGNPVGSNSPTYINAALANGDQVKVQLTSNVNCPTGSPATSSTITMTVNPNLPVTVSIVASANPICSGNSVTFTATPVNGGALPSYQWLLNGNPVGSNTATYTNSGLANGDQIKVVLTSNAVCATGSPATSNTVTMAVSAVAPVSVAILSSANPICAGTSVTFTATPVNGGATPAYQWLLNGNPVGSNSSTYTNATLANGDQVKVVLTSSSTCATGNPATSNTISMTVNSNLPVAVSIAASANPICTGTAVTYTATPVNGGITPAYQWLLNGNPVGSNTATYTNATLANADQVKVILTSNALCATGSPATSNTVNMTVNPNLPVAVSVAASANPICAGTSVTFTATPTNGGVTPVYQWQLNGSPVGSNSPTYTNAALVNGDQVKVQLTSNAACATGSPATSNTVTMMVNPVLPVSISIIADQNPICVGTLVTFTATPVNGGALPAYQWLLNGNPVGSNIPTYTNATLTNGDQVKVVLTSNSLCATGSPATSNIINMAVGPPVPVSVSIVSSANPICTGTAVTFTATPVNGGATPAYQWLLNGNPVGGNSASYTNVTLAIGDQVKVVLNSSISCSSGSPANSNTVTMTVNPNLPVSVNIAVNQNPICAGTSVTFTATPTNGGGTPVYQWLLNGNPVGSNSPTYTNAALVNGDQVKVQLTSNAACATGSPATSNVVNMTVNPVLPVSIDIAADKNPICAGTTVKFTATPINEGANPSFQWLLNGNPVGANSTSYSSNTLLDGDQVSITLISNALCATGSPAISNTIDLIVNTYPIIDLGTDQNICQGQSASFDAGNPGATFQWSSGQNSQQITVSNASTYTVTVTSNGCSTKDSAELFVQPAIFVDFGPDQQLCAGNAITLSTGISGANYQWSTGDTTPSIIANINGTYNVLVTKGPCTTTDQVTFSFDLQPPTAVYLGPDTILCEGESILLDAGSQTNADYIWQDGSTSTTLLADKDDVYFVILSNQCGEESDTVQVIIDDCTCTVYVPTAFSPNTDGNNDLFLPIPTCNIINYHFGVYNRWNELVFETDDPVRGWDGIYHGHPQTVDVYIYYVSYTVERTGKSHLIKGTATLLR